MDSDKKKQLSLGVIFSYIAVVAQCASGLLYTPVILHSLGQSEYGIYSLCISFSGYLTIFNGGANAAYTRFYVQTKVNNDKMLGKLNGTFAWIFAGMSVFSFLGGFLLSWKAELFFGSQIRPEEYIVLKKSFLVLAFLTSVTVINCIFSSLIIANEKFLVAKVVQILNIIAAPVLTVPFLLNGKNSLVILEIKLLLAVVMLLYNMYYCFHYLHMEFEFGKIDKILMKSICVFAGFIVIQGITDQVNWQIDKFLLARFCGTEEISLYSVGTTFNQYYITMGSAMAGVFIAEINRLAASGQNKKLSDLFVKTSRIFALMIFLIMSAYCIFGKQFIGRWAGQEYDISYYVGMFIMFPVTFSLTMGIGQDIVRAKNIHKIQILINSAVCVLNLLISIPLAKYFGALGSAFGTFVAEVMICIVIQSIYYQHMAKLNMKAYYNQMLQMLPGLVIPVVYGIVINYFKLVKCTYGSVIINGTIYVFIYFTSMWFLAMNDNEKHMVKASILKILYKFKV